MITGKLVAHINKDSANASEHDAVDEDAPANGTKTTGATAPPREITFPESRNEDVPVSAPLVLADVQPAAASFTAPTPSGARSVGGTTEGDAEPARRRVSS